MQYFVGSYIVTFLGIILAWLWGNHIQSGAGLEAVFIVLVLGVLEVSLSFDNAVVNAMKLAKMEKKWEQRFLTWGILIAVFGMRFLFPIAVVAVFAKISMLEVAKIAFTNAHLYTHYLHLTHAPIVSFGGTFLLMLFLSYFFSDKKDVHWIKYFERRMKSVGNVNGAEVVISLLLLFFIQSHVAESQRLAVVISGMFGVITYLFIDGFAHWLEKKEFQRAKNITNTVKGAGLVSFLYLELIDASFSLDGVLGAFALSKDIVIITIGLSIGAMFVRSLTVMLVEKKTLSKYLYLEHGAHWAIGALALIMLVSTFHEVPEVLTGLIGLVFILASLASSLVHNKRVNREL